MIYTLTPPVNVGDFNNPLQVDELEISAVSINLDAHPEPVLSVVLIHRASGWKHTVTYQDATALVFWQSLNGGDAVSSVVFAKLTADGKLPTGTLA